MLPVLLAPLAPVIEATLLPLLQSCTVRVAIGTAVGVVVGAKVQESLDRDRIEELVALVSRSEFSAQKEREDNDLLREEMRSFLRHHFPRS